MKSSKFTTLALILTLTLGLFFSMCSKAPEVIISPSAKLGSNSTNNFSVTGKVIDENSKELALKISKDPDWLAYNTISKKLLLI